MKVIPETSRVHLIRYIRFYYQELYDQGANLMRYDYIPSKDSISQFGYGLLTQVHDFSEGKYNQTCIKRSPLGQGESGLIRQVTS